MKIEQTNQVHTIQRAKANVIPIFYASDEKYLPYTAVSLQSLKENANRAYRYEIYILHAGNLGEKAKQIKTTYEEKDFTIQFVDVKPQLLQVQVDLQLRDYYTSATYYRIFIPQLFPQYEKVVYLDSDTVLLASVSDLYFTDVKDHFVGAVADGVVATVPTFQTYTQEALGIDYTKYFNAGVLVMNLSALRAQNFYERFCALLKTYKFSVAQDQDYLNVICKDKTLALPKEWNQMPIKGERGKRPKLIHYNLTMKPWQYEGVLYEEYFWDYAEKTPFSKEIRQAFLYYTQEEKNRDEEYGKNLIALAIFEAERADNYCKKFAKKR